MITMRSARTILIVLLIVVGCKSTEIGSLRGSAFGKEEIQKAIAAGKLQHVYYDGEVLKSEDGFRFQRASVTLPNGTTADGFRLARSGGDLLAIDVVCSCDGMSSSGACSQIGSEPLGISCGGSCEGCEAFVLF